MAFLNRLELWRESFEAVRSIVAENEPLGLSTLNQIALILVQASPQQIEQHHGQWSKVLDEGDAIVDALAIEFAISESKTE